MNKNLFPTKTHLNIISVNSPIANIIFFGKLDLLAKIVQKNMIFTKNENYELEVTFFFQKKSNTFHYVSCKK